MYINPDSSRFHSTRLPSQWLGSIGVSRASAAWNASNCRCGQVTFCGADPIDDPASYSPRQPRFSAVPERARRRIRLPQRERIVEAHGEGVPHRARHRAAGELGSAYCVLSCR